MIKIILVLMMSIAGGDPEVVLQKPVPTIDACADAALEAMDAAVKRDSKEGVQYQVSCLVIVPRVNPA